VWSKSSKEINKERPLLKSYVTKHILFEVPVARHVKPKGTLFHNKVFGWTFGICADILVRELRSTAKVI